MGLKTYCGKENGGAYVMQFAPKDCGDLLRRTFTPQPSCLPGHSICSLAKLVLYTAVTERS